MPLCGVAFLTLLGAVAAFFREEGVQRWCSEYLAPLLVALSGFVTKKQSKEDATTFATAV